MTFFKFMFRLENLEIDALEEMPILFLLLLFKLCFENSWNGF